MPKKVLTEIHNKLCYVDWALTAHEKILKANESDFYYEPEGKVSKYRESIINVIGHAIADCVTRQKEFAHTTLDGIPKLITFKANPQDYEPKHWNAVILYNLVERLIHDDEINKKIDADSIQDFDTSDLLKSIKDNLMEYYDSIYNIVDVEEKLKNAVQDIIKYNKQLELDEILHEFHNKINKINMDINLGNKVQKHEDYVRTPRFSESISEITKQYEETQNEELNNPPINFELGNYYQLWQPQKQTQPQMQFKVRLQYRPKKPINEQWRLADHDDALKFVSGKNAQLEDYSHFLVGNFQDYLNFLKNKTLNDDRQQLFKCFIQFIECDLELDASQERDYQLWSKHPNRSYHGKGIWLINPPGEAFYPKDWPEKQDIVEEALEELDESPEEEVVTPDYHVYLVLKDKKSKCGYLDDDDQKTLDELEKYYKGYKTIDPKNRPRPVAD